MIEEADSTWSGEAAFGVSRRAAIRFGGGAFAALVLAACGDDASAGQDSERDQPVTEFTIVAEDVKWDIDRITVPVGERVVATIENRDGGIPHNLHIRSPGDPRTELENGVVTQTLNFTIAEPGEYGFVCDAHPNMTGTVVAV
ncbi:MAG: cupredoxin domain-containing protein [Acidimicrobiales bacterium]|nr:cupredoxin domain-containing protein [Acidimicrobiales bacterium]